MWNSIRRYRQNQARRRLMPGAARSGMGLTAKTALAILALIILAAALLELRGGGGVDAAIVEHVRAAQVDALELVVGGARARRLVFLADVAGSPQPKRFAAAVIEALATGPGLDAVALAVDAELQPIIDRYLDSSPEDASILLARPRTLREWEGTGQSYLDVYRAVWRVNQELGADRRIRIFAVDLPGWPLAAGRPPNQVANLFAQRDDHMAATLEELVLRRDPRARVLFFGDALHTLKVGGATIQTGGTGLVQAEWLAARMRRLHPGEGFSVLVDAPAGRAVAVDVVTYRASRLNEALRRGTGLPARFGLRLDAGPLDDFIRPIRTNSAAGMSVELVPQDYRLRDVADGYVYLGG